MQDNRPYVISKKHTVRRIYWGRIAFAAVLVSLLAIGAVLWFSRTTAMYTMPTQTYWCISLGEYDSVTEAAGRADTVVQAGGAGYVLGESPYRVVAACYAAHDDAITVSGRLEEAGEQPQIIALSAPSVRLKKPKKQAARLRSMLAMPAGIFGELYDISVKTDTKEITESAAKYAVLKMHVACEGYARECSAFEGEVGILLSDLLTSFLPSLEAVAQARENISQCIKYSLCEIADNICARTSSFANKLKNVS